MDIQRLEIKIVAAAMKYYGSGEVTMSDQAFDMLTGKLRQADPNHWLLHTPGWGYVPDSNKVQHVGKGLVRGLGKEQFPVVKDRMKNAVWTPKFDGLTEVLYSYYTKRLGLKVTGVTRGDGKVGKDNSPKLWEILNRENADILLNLEQKTGVWSCRGEIIVNPIYGNLLRDQGVISFRNWASGVMNRDEITEDLKYLQFIPYVIRIDQDQGAYEDQIHMLQELENMGFDKCPYVSTEHVTPEWIQELHTNWSRQYPIDGLCYTDDSEWLAITENGDMSNFAELYTVAYKMPTETKEVVVESVEWKTGSAGRCTPTVIYEPVELLGAMLGRATGHHAKFIKESEIGPGAIIEITRANEVMPKITDIVDGSEAEIPTHCSACKADLEWDNCYLSCPNFDCPAKAHTTLYRLLGAAGIPDGLSEISVSKWLKAYPTNGVVVSIENIFDFLPQFVQSGIKNIAPRHELLMQHFQKHYGTLLWQLEVNVEKKLTEGFSYEEFWYLLNLKQLGPATAAKLSTVDPNALFLEFQIVIPPEATQEEIDKKTYEHADSLAERLLKHGLNKSARASMINEFGYWSKLSQMLVLKKVDAPEGVFSGKNIVFTGIRLKGIHKKRFLEAGGKEASSVSKKTDIVVTDNPSGTTTKLKKARDYKKPIVTVEQLMEMIK